MQSPLSFYFSPIPSKDLTTGVFHGIYLSRDTLDFGVDDFGSEFLQEKNVTYS